MVQFSNKAISQRSVGVSVADSSNYITNSSRQFYDPSLAEELRHDEPSQHIYIPMKTKDYIIHRGSKGLSLVANRDIHEGESVFENSLQYTVTDVENCDYALFNGSKLFSRGNDGNVSHVKDAYNVVPARVPLQTEMIFTHAIPILSDGEESGSRGIISHHLRIPNLLVNHSCDPNTVHDDGNDGHERHYAVRDIRRGEELTVNYSLIYYDEGPIHHKCLCGSSNCNGQILGFKDYEIDQQERLMPLISHAVRAMFMADQKVGELLLNEQPLVAERVVQAPMFSTKKAIRMVCPNPSAGMSDIGISISDDGVNNLYSMRDFKEGEEVYRFWVDDWPMGGKIPIEMVCPTAIRPGDPVEGTSIWLDPLECGYKDSRGKVKFSCFNALIQHSCDPNIVYKQTKRTEYDSWQVAYAARPILKGQILVADLNSMFWDRTGLKIATCSCGADGCAGTVKGFKFLSPIRQKKRWVERDNGRYLSPRVREQCKKRDGYYDEMVDYDSVRINSEARDVRINSEARDVRGTLSARVRPNAHFNPRSVLKKPSMIRRRSSAMSSIDDSIPTSIESSSSSESSEDSPVTWGQFWG